jgi:hypothetical protein
MQLYMMDLCTYDSLMPVLLADISLVDNKKADLASFLFVAFHMLAARVGCYQRQLEWLTKRRIFAWPYLIGLTAATNVARSSAATSCFALQRPCAPIEHRRRCSVLSVHRTCSILVVNPG